MIEKTAARLLVDTLSRHGTEQVFCVPGESYLAVLDALLDHPETQMITCRHEGAAAFMAESRGKLTGRPGICFVTRGPGACNAAIGVHTAMQDSTPMILFMGQVSRQHKGREAFQEIGVADVFGSLAKWATEIDDPADMPNVLARAFEVALSGRPGPVVIGLPEDMLREKTKAVPIPPRDILSGKPSDESLAALKVMLESAENPVVVVGGSGWTDRACADFTRFANRCGLPVAASFRRQDIFNHKDDCYVGELGTGSNPALVQKIKEADLLLVLGARLNETMTQGYTLLDRQKLIHVHPSGKEPDKIYMTDMAIQSNMENMAAALSGLTVADGGVRRAEWRAHLRGLYQDWTAIDPAGLCEWRDGADMTAIFGFLRDHLPDDAVITTDAGNFSGWAQRYLYYGRPGRLLAPISGAMGYAVPAAIAAALWAPGRRTVLGLCGDGGFMMTGQELATAMHHNASPVIMICNNSMFGTIRMHQEKDYPGRVSATGLTNPDFVALAESYGAFAARVEDAGDFAGVWESAQKAEKLAVIEVKMDPAQLKTTSQP